MCDWGYCYVGEWIGICVSVLRGVGMLGVSGVVSHNAVV